MSVKGWNFKLLIAVGHGSKRGRRVRLPSSAPYASTLRLQNLIIPMILNFVGTCSITRFLPNCCHRVVTRESLTVQVG